MKILTSVFWLLCLTNFVFGQDTSARKTDSAKQIQVLMISDPAILKNHESLIIVNDTRKGKSSSKHFFEKVNPGDIFEISVLKDTLAKALYGSKAANGVIIITTKQYAISQYQQKFCKFSKAYKHYIDSLKSDDKQITYVIDGKFLIDKGRNDEISQLYKISKEKIGDVVFKENPYYNGLPSTKYWLLIATKQ
jgi:TonB-dependent SusC/RagA subfamily outer membrane receptor